MRSNKLSFFASLSATRRWRDPSKIALWTDHAAIFGGRALILGRSPNQKSAYSAYKEKLWSEVLALRKTICLIVFSR